MAWMAVIGVLALVVGVVVAAWGAGVEGVEGIVIALTGGGIGCCILSLRE